MSNEFTLTVFSNQKTPAFQVSVFRVSRYYKFSPRPVIDNLAPNDVETELDIIKQAKTLEFDVVAGTIHSTLLYQRYLLKAKLDLVTLDYTHNGHAWGALEFEKVAIDDFTIWPCTGVCKELDLGTRWAVTLSADSAERYAGRRYSQHLLDIDRWRDK